MEKFIYTYNWGGEPCGGTSYVCFEYESKDKFVYDILEKYKNHKWEYYGDGRSDYDTSTIPLFNDSYLTKYELETIEQRILTLDEWFSGNKEEI